MSTKDSVYEIPDVQKDMNKEFENEFINERINLAIAGLAEKFKTVIVLRDIQELSYEDISAIVGVPLGTVKSRINRARIQLQAELQDIKS